MAADFEASSSQYGLKTSPSAALRLNHDSWIDVWVKSESSAGTDQKTLFNRTGTGGEMYSAYYGATMEDLNYYASSSGVGGTIRTVNASPDQASTWFHLAFRRAGTSMVVYQNGARLGNVTAGPASIHNGTADLGIGARNNGTHLFDGMIQEVRMWNTSVISVVEVRNLWNKRIDGTVYESHAGLVEYWPLISDGVSKTGNNNLTFPNSVTWVDADPEWLSVGNNRTVFLPLNLQATSSISTTTRTLSSISATATLTSVLGAGSGVTPDEIAPQVTNISPAADSEITPTQAIQFDITDETGLSGLLPMVHYPTLGRRELIHDGTNFIGAYASLSTRSIIAGGFRYTVRHESGWPDSPTFYPYAFDGGGNLLS